MKKKGLSLEQELKQSFERWNHIFKHGCKDPYWADGINLNLVRNHISYYKKQLAEANQFPEIYYLETPPEVENNYVARTDEIFYNAKRSLDLYKNNEDYTFTEFDFNNMDALTELNFVEVLSILETNRFVFLP
jgi:hypothetical protein